ncbi:hypothetical protein [Burkholderia sp. 22PA0106]|uniref:hypothetical protein n=1 Tax=Burkholderia sp. 22PA0106 TaxID=3237371 RepID=UPI0039C1B903
MPLIQIPVLTADQYPTAALNPAQVVTISRSTTAPGGTTIGLNARDPQAVTHTPPVRARTLTSPTPLVDVLAALTAAGVPLVPVELKSATPLDYHVNPNAIVAVQPMKTGNGHVWLSNGEILFVTPDALQALSALLVAPPAAVAAGRI